MKNIGAIILAHNWNILSPIVKSYGCNCSVESRCNLNSECLNPKIIYRANVSNDQNSDKKKLLPFSRYTLQRKVQKPHKDIKHEKYGSSTGSAKLKYLTIET